MNKKFKLENINLARNLIMGIATLFIIIFHTYLDYGNITDNKIISSLILSLYHRFNVGVDIFLFVSGIGLYFSFKKNKLSIFYKNRFIRIIPSFLLAMILFYIYFVKILDINILKLLTLQLFFLDGNRFCWYVQFILVLYLVFPLIYKIIDEKGFSGLLVSVFVIIVVNSLYSLVFPVSYQKIEICLTRIPIFIVGTYFGKMIYNKESISNRIVYVSMILPIVIYFLIYLFFDSYLYMCVQRYLYCILGISLVICIAYFYSRIKNKNNIFFKMLSFLGFYSLEIYLFYEAISKVLLVKINCDIKIVIYIISLIATVIMAVFVRKIFNLFMSLVIKLKKKLDK